MHLQVLDESISIKEQLNWVCRTSVCTNTTDIDYLFGCLKHCNYKTIPLYTDESYVWIK